MRFNHYERIWHVVFRFFPDPVEPLNRKMEFYRINEIPTSLTKVDAEFHPARIVTSIVRILFGLFFRSAECWGRGFSPRNLPDVYPHTSSVGRSMDVV